MQTELHELHRRLSQLRRHRRWCRWSSASCSFLVASIWLLLALFAVDLLFETDVLQRLVLLAIAVAILCWICARYVWPLLQVREDEIDLALQVEKRQAVDNDLVAALQFASPEAGLWGARSLQQVVIQNASQLAGRAELFQLPQPWQIGRRLRWLAVSLLVAGLVTLLWPQHLAIFFQRLALGSQHYPSRTVIDQITVNGEVVLAGSRSMQPRLIKCVENSTVDFAVLCTRHPPEVGELRVVLDQGSSPQRIALWPKGKQGDAREIRQQHVFVGQVPVLYDSLEYQLFLGDAWTESGVVQMIPLPRVEVDVQVTAPEYAAETVEYGLSDQRRLVALEGSSAQLVVRCTNNKRLSAVTVTLNDRREGDSETLEFSSEPNGQWRLRQPRAARLNELKNDLAFEIHVTDVDGLSPEAVLDGEIRIKADREPEATLWCDHSVVVPDGVPTLGYRVQDDFGIAAASLEIQEITPQPAAPGEQDLDDPSLPSVMDVRPSDMPVLGEELPMVGETRIDLAPRKLDVGDVVGVVLAATDDRGTDGGVTVRSKPVLVRIADPRQVLANILETDQQTVVALDKLIREQMRITEQQDSNAGRRLQQEIQAGTEKLGSEVLDGQLQRLRDNRMEGLPAFGDIKTTRQALSTLLENEMEVVLQRLSAADDPETEQPLRMDERIRNATRKIVQVLTTERDRVRRRMKVAALALQMQELIVQETETRDRTRGLMDLPDDTRNDSALAVVNDQKDAQMLFQQLLKSLTTVAQWNGEAATAAGEALEILDREAVQETFAEAEASLLQGRLAEAEQRQTEILEKLAAAQLRADRLHGMRHTMDPQIFETVQEIRRQQQAVLEDTRQANPNDRQMLDKLTDRQGQVRAELTALEETASATTDINRFVPPSRSAASQAEQELFTGEPSAAVPPQEQVIQHLSQLEQSLRAAKVAAEGTRNGSLVDQIQQLEQLEEQLGELDQQQSGVVDQAAGDPRAAAELEQVIADELKAQASRDPIPEQVQRQVETAATQAQQAVTALSQQSAEAQTTRQQAANQAQHAVRQALADTTTALSAARQQQRGAEMPEGSMPELAEMEGVESMTESADSSSQSSSSNGTAAARQGNRMTGDQGRMARAGSSVESQPFNGDGRPWFAELPVELREAIRSRVRRQPPRGYEQRLRRYFESSHD